MTTTLRWLALAVLLASGGAATGAAAQAAPRFGVRAAETAEGWQPVVDAANLLQDRSLQGALESGLPLRFRLRVELWRKGFFDQLVGAEELNFVLVRDPLDGLFHLDAAQRGARVFGSLLDAQRALQLAFRPSLPPERGGRHYYLGVLEVETLSLSDLEELRRWLRGDFQPAVEGRAPAGRAVERGLRRVLVRVIGLPTRRYEDRSGTFVAP